jgi:hypothetical protein
MGNDEAATKEKDGLIGSATIGSRQEKNWGSSVFAGPESNKVNRKVLSKQGCGNAGLYGDLDDPSNR